jgi:hypothetical protein
MAQGQTAFLYCAELYAKYGLSLPPEPDKQDAAAARPAASGGLNAQSTAAPPAAPSKSHHLQQQQDVQQQQQQRLVHHVSIPQPRMSSSDSAASALTGAAVASLAPGQTPGFQLPFGQLPPPFS